MSVANSEELNLIPWDSHSIRRETTSLDCPLSSIQVPWHTHVCMHTYVHMHTNTNKKV